MCVCNLHMFELIKIFNISMIVLFFCCILQRRCCQVSIDTAGCVSRVLWTEKSRLGGVAMYYTNHMRKIHLSTRNSYQSKSDRVRLVSGSETFSFCVDLIQFITLWTMWHNEEVEYMDTSDSPWCWYYLADCGRWHKFEVNDFHCQCFTQSFTKTGLKELKLNKSGCDFLSTLQDDPTNPLQSKNIEKYYLRDPKAVISISSFNCHIKTDFSGICLHLLFHFKSQLTNEEHI